MLVEGRIATREYRDREDVARTVTEIVVAGRQGVVNVLSSRRPDPDPSAPAREAAGGAAGTGDAGTGGGAALEEAA